MITITDFFGWIGVIVSICFFASPILKFINLIKKKIDYKDINIIIILGNYISSIVWLIYGYQIKIKQIIVCYSIGALISLIFIWIYLVYMGKKKMNQALICTILLSVLSFVIYIVLMVIINDKKILGEVCFIVCSLSYISPTQLLIKVLNTKDYKLIPIYSAIISAVGYGSWTIFGLLKFNATIIIPNLVGLGFALAQIILYRVYKNKRALTEELGNISTTVIGAVKNVVDKTVEIANSINTTNPQNNNNSAAPPNTSVSPVLVNDSINNNNNNDFDFNVDNNVNNNENNNNNMNNVNNTNSTNNDHVDTNTSLNFNTNPEETNASVNVNNINDNKENNDNIDVPNI